MWYLDSIRIIVQEENREASQIIPRLQPLAGGTIMQIFGFERAIITINAYIVGLTDASQIVQLTEDASPHILTGPEGVISTVYVSKVGLKRIQTRYQTLRTDLDCEAPVFLATITLFTTDM